MGMNPQYWVAQEPVVEGKIVKEGSTGQDGSSAPLEGLAVSNPDLVRGKSWEMRDQYGQAVVVALPQEGERKIGLMKQGGISLKINEVI